MTQIERKLNKMPGSFKKRLNGIKYKFDLLITKEQDLWVIIYRSKEYESNIIEITHESLQVAVDTMLAELRRIKIIK